MSDRAKTRLETLVSHLAPSRLLSAATTTVSSSMKQRHEKSTNEASAPLTLSRSDVTLSPDVARALARGQAVVALESTIITHGMPYPDNVATAREVEGIVSSGGAVPATIALLNGVIHVGLTDEALEALGSSPVEKMLKVSRRDLARAVATKATGGTTVAATMAVAGAVGIKVFVTGGIGGVHRGGEVSMDISADLTELARTPVAVICAGPKSLLDARRTLEVLETSGVPVVGYGTSLLPGFFTAATDVPVPSRVDSPDDAAALIATSNRLGLSAGTLITVPVPLHAEADAKLVSQATEQAVAEAEKQGIKGAKITPFLLARIAELTGGSSLRANKALIRHNAEVGSAIAVALAALGRTTGGGSAANGIEQLTTSSSSSSSSSSGEDGGDDGRELDVVVIGGATLDVTSTPYGSGLVAGDSVPGNVTMSGGGVGRNIAEAAGRLGLVPALVSSVGTDAAGGVILNSLTSSGVCIKSMSITSDSPSAVYSALLHPNGALAASVAGTASMEASLAPQVVQDRLRHALSRGPGIRLAIVDANLSPEALRAAVQTCVDADIPVWYEPTSAAKAPRAVTAAILHACTYTSPNVGELVAISDAVDPSLAATANVQSHLALGADGTLPGDDGMVYCVEALQRRMYALLKLGLSAVITTMSSGGLLLGQAGTEESPEPVFRYWPAPPEPAGGIVSVTGAGDCLVAGIAAEMILSNAGLEESIGAGLSAASQSLASPIAVPAGLGRG